MIYCHRLFCYSICHAPQTDMQDLKVCDMCMQAWMCAGLWGARAAAAGSSWLSCEVAAATRSLLSLAGCSPAHPTDVQSVCHMPLQC